jgi:flagellar hook-basal body complex protein FliE
MEINSLLLQMRAMAARAQGVEMPVAAIPTAKSDGFGAMFKSALDQVNSAQMRATEMSTAVETGASDADISEVMLAIQKASLGFQAVTQVRNKVVAAYQEIMNMQV